MPKSDEQHFVRLCKNVDIKSGIMRGMKFGFVSYKPVPHPLAWSKTMPQWWEQEDEEIRECQTHRDA